ncbi:Uncharacterised protein [Nocardia africana]|uniref:Uncharacterized protein n=1 Tax=Nocardia africana TaxID=134964 RepID=A0A378WZR8_9NOCA|nr:Uncharacterised protein [Nocardia africana]
MDTDPVSPGTDLPSVVEKGFTYVETTDRIKSPPYVERTPKSLLKSAKAPGKTFLPQHPVIAHG